MIKDYVALDLETTGLSPKEDRIIEIGMAKISEGKVIEKYETFINPGILLSKKVTELTGISDGMLKNAPEIEEKIGEAVEFTENLPLLGHNVMFDYSFLKKCCINSGIKFEKKGIDTLKIARRVLEALPQKNLSYLCHYYGIADGREHRALYDAIKAHELYWCLAKTNKELTETFEPQELKFNIKKQQPITKSQNEYLKNLIKYHKIEVVSVLSLATEDDIKSLTKSQASRIIDYIILNYGRIDTTL